MFRKLIDAGRDAAARPFIRRRRDNLVPGLRAVIVHPSLLFYRVENLEVEVVRVIHERRDIEAALNSKPPEG
jgi:plasmid stabilization system protein ParE